MADEKRKAFFSIVFFLTLFCLFFWKSFQPEKLFFYLDHGFQNIPFRYFAYNSISDGIIPLWCPYSAAGFPLFAEGQSGVAYLVNWLFYLVLPFSLAYNWSLLSHLFILGIGVFTLFRRFDYSSLSSLTGTLAFTFSGYFIRKLMFVNFIQSIALLPWLLLIIIPGKKIKVFHRIAIGSAIIGTQCFIGHPQVVMMSLLISWLFFLCSPFEYRRFSYLVIPTGITGIGLLFGSWQLLPTLELTTKTMRFAANQLSGQMSLPPAYLPTVFLNHPFGSASDGTFNLSLWPAYEWELSMFTGISVLALAFFSGKTEQKSRFFKGCILIGVILAIGHYTVFHRLLDSIPIMNSFRAPARWSIVAVWGLVGLAVHAINRLEISTRQHGLKLAQLAMISFMLFFALGSLAFFTYSNGLWFTNTSMVFALKGATVFLSCLLLLVLLFIVSGNKRVLLALPLCVFAELYWANHQYPAIGESKIIIGQPREFLNIDKTGRVLSLVHEVSPFVSQNWHKKWALDNSGDYQVMKDSYPMYLGMINKFDLLTFNEWSSLHYKTYFNWAAHAGVLQKRTIRNFNITQVITPVGNPLFQGTIVGRVKDWEIRKIDANLSERSRFRIPEFTLETDEELLRRMVKSKNDSSVFISASKLVFPENSWARTGRVSIWDKGINEKQIDVFSKKRACILLNESFDKGWKIQSHLVDSKAALYKADTLFLSLCCEEGDHRFTLRFEPVSYRLGFFVTCVTLTVIGLLFIVGRGSAMIGSIVKIADAGYHGASSAWVVFCV
ncbi:hypothetical protein K8T06_05445, partial [bacterium]|nr:hypothetical protein [bacterium]